MSNLVLYRRYRPKNFAEVIGQEHIKTTLANAVVKGRIGHAYLFTGPRGVGKTTLARIFARAVNCPNRSGNEPCNACEICKSFLDGSSLDLLEIDAASHTGVDNIRELIEHLQFAPTRATYKVIIVDEVHMLSKGAFNALLKTLEEPPKHAIFILATTEIHKVPATIVSRTQRFDFRKVSLADLVQLLKFVCDDNQVQASDDALLEVAAAADGSFRDGLSLLDQVINYSGNDVSVSLVEEILGLTGIKTTAEFFELILNNQTQAAVEFISKLSFSGRDLYQFEKDFLEYLRKILLLKVGAQAEFGFSKEVLEQLTQQASQIDLPRLLKVIELFQKAENDIKWTAIQSLPLELAVVEATSMDENSAPLRGVPPIENIQKGGTTRQSDPGKDRHAANQIEPKETAARDGNDALKQVLSHWPQILDKVKDYNHSLVASLKLAEPIALEGKELILLFPYTFHKDAIDARKNRIVVDQVIEEVTGLKLMVRPMVAKDLEVKNDNKKNAMQSALKILGGEIE